MADCTIIDKLNYILETKDLIKTAIETQDVEVLESDTFRKYAQYVTEIRKVASVNGETGDIILKTINGQNLVGEGNIVIQGGEGGGSEPEQYIKMLGEEYPNNLIWYINEKDDYREIKFKTINGNTIMGEGNITVEGGEGGTAGVNKIIMGDEDYGWNSYTGDVKLTNGWVDLDDDGAQETYDIRVGDNSGSSLWFGFNSTDNSIKIEDNGSRLSFTVNPDILGGGGSVTETDPVFTEWKNNETIVAGNGATYDIDGASEEEIHPSIVIGKDASVWADGIAIGENAYSEMGAVTIGKNVTSYGIVSIGSDNEGSGIAIGKNNKGDGIIIGENNNSGSGVAIGKNITENYGGISIGDYTSNPTDSGIAIGFNAKVNTKNTNDTDNGYGIAIGNSAIAYGKNDVAIGKTVETDDAYTTNINNIIKGDSNKYAYIKDENGNYTKILDLINNGGGTAGVSAINVGRDVQDWTQKTGVVSFYTDWYDGSYDVAIGGTSFFGVKPIDNSIVLENAGGTVNGNTRCGIKINTDNFKTINGESIIGEGNITIEGGGGSGTINIIELTQAEYDALTEYADNTFYVITDANKQYTTLEEVEQQGYLKAIPDTYVTDGELSTAISNKVSQTALNEAIEGVETKIPTLQEGWQGNENNYVYSDYTDKNHSVVSRASIGYAYYDDGIEIDVSNTLWGGMSTSESIKIAPVSEEQMGFMTPSDKIKLDSLNGGITEETDPVFTEWKDKTIQVIIGSGATGSDNTQFDNISIGRGARGGNRTIAIGGYSYIDSKFSTSLGTNTKSSADATYSVIIGYSASGNSENSVAIGAKAKVESGVTNGCAIGANTESNATFNTNINNVLKGDTSNYAYILDADGNYVKIIDTYYTKTEIDNLIGGVSDKISDINSMI